MQAFCVSGVRKSYGNDFDKKDNLRDTQISQNSNGTDMLTLRTQGRRIHHHPAPRSGTQDQSPPRQG